MANPQRSATGLTTTSDTRWALPIAMALGVHALLVLALTWGVAWQQTQQAAAFDVELWSDIPIAAAPPPEPVAEPKPEPEPLPTPEPEPEPEPPAPPPPEPEPAGPTAADIALEKQRVQEELEQRRAQQLAKEKADEALKDKKAKEKAAQLAKDKAAKEKAAKEKAAKEKAAKEKAAKEKAAKEKALKDKLRQEQLARLSSMAGTAGQTGEAARASGPSANYAGKVVGAIRPNIVFTDVVQGNPAAEVEVITNPAGDIVGRKLRTSSGSPAWDDAVLRAIDRTGALPRDTNGRVPSPMLIRFRPKD
jgi:colicin import membrane protein